MKRFNFALIITMVLLYIFVLSASQSFGESLTVKDSRGKKVTFPMGGSSFADEVVNFKMGKPAPIKSARDPETTLGPPDCGKKSKDKKKKSCFLTLGHKGELILKFTDNVLVDVDGPDVYIFEIGPQVEATGVEISSDGKEWIYVGTAKGSTSSLDIRPYVKSGQVFRYVKLIDKGRKSSRWPGADIDAVGAIGSARSVLLENEILFDYNSAVIKEKAKVQLDSVIEDLKKEPSYSVKIEGHSSAEGDAVYNLKLSKKRADAIKEYFISKGIKSERLTTVGLGESCPLASNKTEEGRKKNRRVELIIRTIK